MNGLPSRAAVIGRCGIGRIGMSLSPGLWQNFGDTGRYETMKDMILTAFDHGITHFDLANNYGPDNGAAEKNLGRILREKLMPWREELIISTKAGYEMWPGPYGNWGSCKYLPASLDQSLERLGLEYVDIFYHHRMDPDTPLEETMGALYQAVQSGMALYAGLSNYDGESLEKACRILKNLRIPLVISQNRYSILDRTVETDGLLEKNRELEKGLFTFSPLAKGQLTDQYLDGIPADSRIRTGGRLLKESDLPAAMVRELQALNDIAAARGNDLSVLVLRWLLEKEGATSVLIGAGKPVQILTNLRVLDTRPLSDRELVKIDRHAERIRQIEKNIGR